MRWGILRSPSWYPIKTANKIIMACCLLHNYIRNEMVVDLLELDLDDYIMDPYGNLLGKHSAGVKAVRGRRSWTKVEEDALIQCLTDVVNEGWKAENGFRDGFQRELEKGIRKKLLKEYGTLSDLLSKSGIGWNSTNSMIEVEDEAAWDGYRRCFTELQADPHVKGIRFKTWSYYPQWIEIFSKDRATGEHVVDPIDLVNELYRNVMEYEGETGEKMVPLNNEVMHDTEEVSICKPIDSVLKTVYKGKKRKNSEPDLHMLVDS
ncbi:hypothetical protein ACS0TY_034828 [Phlomoides rotata]